MDNTIKKVIDGIEYDVFQATPDSQVADLLTIIAPPVRLVAWLELVFENKRKKGEDVPANFIQWLERWQRIRSDLPAEIDGTTADEWIALERKLFAKPLPPQQNTLLDVSSDVKSIAY